MQHEFRAVLFICFMSALLSTRSHSSSRHSASSIVNALERLSAAEVPVLPYAGPVKVGRAPGGNSNRTSTLKGGNLKAGAIMVAKIRYCI